MVWDCFNSIWALGEIMSCFYCFLLSKRRSVKARICSRNARFYWGRLLGRLRYILVHTIIHGGVSDVGALRLRVETSVLHSNGVAIRLHVVRVRARPL